MEDSANGHVPKQSRIRNDGSLAPKQRTTISSATAQRHFLKVSPILLDPYQVLAVEQRLQRRRSMDQDNEQIAGIIGHSRSPLMRKRKCHDILQPGTGPPLLHHERDYRPLRRVSVIELQNWVVRVIAKTRGEKANSCLVNSANRF